MTDPTPTTPTLPDAGHVRQIENQLPPIVADWSAPFSLTPPSTRGASDAHQPSLLPAGLPKGYRR